MIVIPGAYQMDVGAAWDKYWGGTFGGSHDPVHFELPGAGKEAFAYGEANYPLQNTDSLYNKVAKGAYTVSEDIASPWWSFLIPEKVPNVQIFQPEQASTSYSLAKIVADWFK